ncbi:MAG: hypothetical protein Kow0089_13620 [Desulfobulbaceae bacterium]
MIIIRLVVLAALAYVAWLLLRGITGKRKEKDRKADSKTTEGETPARDVLVEDPVCHTLVPKHQAIRLRSGGKTYYFCSDKCCDTFSESARGEE